MYSFDSSRKSLSANFSPTLCGLVFLIKLELLKSKSWSNIRLSFISGDLNVFPIKYGYNPINLLFNDTPLLSNPPVANPTVLK